MQLLSINLRAVGSHLAQSVRPNQRERERERDSKRLPTDAGALTLDCSNANAMAGSTSRSSSKYATSSGFSERRDSRAFLRASSCITPHHTALSSSPADGPCVAISARTDLFLGVDGLGGVRRCGVRGGGGQGNWSQRRHGVRLNSLLVNANRMCARVELLCT